MDARRTTILLNYQGIEISKDLSPYLLSFTFNDNEGRSDDIQLSLDDREGKWQGPWLPGEGDRIEAYIEVSDWEAEKDNRKLKCGSFYVDSVDIDGPPDVLKLKALSIPLKDGGKNAKRTKSWEEASLASVAGDIAARAGLTLVFDAPNVFYDRVDQVQQTDLSFISELARNEGASTKVSNDQLVVYDDLSYETKTSVRKLFKGEQEITKYSFSKATAEHNYKKCEVSYFDQEKKETLTYTYTAPGVEEGPTLKVRKRVKSIGEAQRLARKSLRNKNRHSMTAKLTVLGDTRLVQGMSVDLRGWGRFTGKYFIESSVHKVSKGYTTQLTLRKGLNY